jgi:hypothetical protein
MHEAPTIAILITRRQHSPRAGGCNHKLVVAELRRLTRFRRTVGIVGQKF